MKGKVVSSSVEVHWYAHITSSCFFRNYVQGVPEWLPAMLISFHYLLHIAQSIRDTGPAWATWQFPMERLCGMLLPLVQSRQHPYINLRNQVTYWMQFTHLKFKDAHGQIFGTLVEEQHSWPTHRVFTTPDSVEELYSPSSMYVLTRTEEHRVKEYYATSWNMTVNAIGASIHLSNK